MEELNSGSMFNKIAQVYKLHTTGELALNQHGSHFFVINGESAQHCPIVLNSASHPVSSFINERKINCG